MARFSIPFNGDLDLMREAVASGQVEEIYFSGARDHNVSDWYVDADEVLSYEQARVEALVALCRAEGVRSNLLLNLASLYFEDLSRAAAYARALGVDAVTVADPYAVTALRDALPGVEIQLSVNLALDSFAKVERMLRLGAGTINVAGKMNRDIVGLQRLRVLKERFPAFRVKLLATYICHYDCPFWAAHATLSVHREHGDHSRRSCFGADIDIDACAVPAEDLMDLIRRPFIRPEDLSYYEEAGGVDVFKLAFRNDDSETLRRIFRAYFERRWSADLFDIIPRGPQWPELACDNTAFPAGFVHKVTTCDKVCSECDYCARVAERVLQPASR
ncbi:MAG: hypothetical protein EP329_08035 [Deltaproteobacteria bacterium]|nr:MAG: hypothetical protein EP329_08035 [Deltaproteobacteria bacterium]